MKFTSNICRALFSVFLFISIICLTQELYAQNDQSSSFNRDTLISVAREYISTVPYCALVTIDSDGIPNVRTMDPFPPDEDMVIWLGTNRYSRKVQEIKNNPKVALYYSNNNGAGYVSITGIASLVDDPEKKAALWKDAWKNFYSNKEEQYLLIKIIPEKLELVDYSRGIYNDKETWQTPFVEFNISEQNLK
jgi:general stress protein 26